MVAKKKGPSRVEMAAGIYGCEVGELMAWHEFEDGSVAIIAPSGQKFTYPADRLAQERMEPVEPAPASVMARHSEEPLTIQPPQDETPTNISEHAGETVPKKKSSTNPRSARKPDQLVPNRLIDESTDP